MSLLCFFVKFTSCSIMLYGWFIRWHGGGSNSYLLMSDLFLLVVAALFSDRCRSNGRTRAPLHRLIGRLAHVVVAEQRP